MTDTATGLPEIAHGVVVRPGDTLLVAVPGTVRPEQMGDLKEGLGNRLPGVADVVVVAGVDQLAVYRPDGSRPAGEPRCDAPEQHDQ